jgi:hypothetical protein
MNSAETLLAMDRCPRAAFWGEKWEGPAINPNEVLRRAVDAGLLTEESDPGQLAGDTVMTLAAERTLDVEGSQYSCALHHAALADIIVTALRGNGERWARPADLESKGVTWVSSAFLAASGVRLHRVLLADRWSTERFQSETHSWKGLGEVSAYGMPMTMTVVLIGQRRGAVHHSPWSKGWLHPKSRTLRIRKRAGEFKYNWTECWRETADFNRDHWLDSMREDYVLNDVLFEREIPVPDGAVLAKIAHLAGKKLRTLRDTTEVPDPNPSVCDWPVPCQFRSVCWNFRPEPTERDGFIPVGALTSAQSA